MTVTVDENGAGNLQDANGMTLFTGTLKNDPGPGGLPSILTYTLPFTGVQGDVNITNSSEGLLDVVRFNGDGTLLFYSDNISGFDSIGDTSSPPLNSYTNIATADEIGNEVNNGAFYTPTPGQPGYDAEFQPTYHLISDGSI